MAQSKHDARISIHALREEGDISSSTAGIKLSQFLSTPSARRATPHWPRYASRKKFLSTPSARRATSAAPAKSPPRVISIHALREEGDALVRDAGFHTRDISIHALREEGDAGIGADS